MFRFSNRIPHDKIMTKVSEGKRSKRKRRLRRPVVQTKLGRKIFCNTIKTKKHNAKRIEDAEVSDRISVPMDIRAVFNKFIDEMITHRCCRTKDNGQWITVIVVPFRKFPILHTATNKMESIIWHPLCFCNV